ncbi:MAG TPA: PDZ domain-containing protein, partial [Gemmatimonadota bacterium]|nr:PDZ domain-containing protein [Gemmatimonadota bacterium]
FVNHPVVPLTSVTAMINMDMVGRLRDELIVYGVGSSAAWPDLLERANADVQLPLRLMAEGYGPSDHAPFYLRQVPVVAMFTGVHQDYHRASDDADLLDYAGLTQVTTFVRELVGRLAGSGERLVFRPSTYALADERASTPVAPPLDQPVSVGRRLGAVPLPAGPGEPVVVDRIETGSPAERAGVRPGDRILSLDGIPVESIYDYVRALQRSVSDGAARLVLERDGRPLELDVDLQEAR